jgi:2-polyprenyl-3-methyl-5-hydroxy-6-metoxy-1,4-benzoquinol methylase
VHILCRHAFVAPTPSHQWLASFYDTAKDTLENSSSWTIAADYKQNPKIIRRMYVKTRIKSLKRQGLLYSKEQVTCDIGSATGCFLAVLSDFGFKNLRGCEISGTQAGYCRETFGIETVEQISDIPSHSVDLVTAYAVLEHATDPRSMLLECKRILKIGGSLVIDVPNTRSFYELVAKQNWIWLIPPAHLNYFSPASLKSLLKQTGFDVTSARALSTSTYTFLLVYHLCTWLNRPLPETALSSSWIKRALVNLIEASLRLLLWPASFIASLTMRHNQLIFTATPKSLGSVNVRP